MENSIASLLQRVQYHLEVIYAEVDLAENTTSLSERLLEIMGIGEACHRR